MKWHHSSFLSAIIRDLIKDALWQWQILTKIYFWNFRDIYVVVIEDSQFSLLWNGFWDKWEGQMDRLTLKLGTSKLLLTICFYYWSIKYFWNSNKIYTLASSFIFSFRIYNKFSYLVSFADFHSTEFMVAFASFNHTKYFLCFLLQ